MATVEEVEVFLVVFKDKMERDDIIFVNRLKNSEALVALEIDPSYRIRILKELIVENYAQGPSPDYHGGTAIWVFGYLLNAIEIYIKVTLKIEGMPCVCISFHVADFPIYYPLR